MVRNAESSSTPVRHAPLPSGERKYKGVRRRKWGRWVSEIRVPNNRERIWLGSYGTPDVRDDESMDKKKVVDVSDDHESEKGRSE
jgi:hypothetical protein